MDYFKSIFIYAWTVTLRFFRDLTAMFFTLVFPLIFLFVFGGIFGGDQSISFDLGLINKSDNQFANTFVRTLEESDVFEVSEIDNLAEGKKLAGRGELDAIVEIPETFGQIDMNSSLPSGTLITYIDEGEQELKQSLEGILQIILDGINNELVAQQEPFNLESKSLRTDNLSSLDYLVPGLLGFSIMSLGIFGLANSLPAIKKEKILRRLKVTPFTSTQFVIGTGLHYMVIGLLAVVVMLVAGIVVFDFTMKGNYFNLLIFTIISVIAMIGFGLAIGGWARNENQAAPIANIIAFPMMFLSGVFFPRFLMPEWLQTISTYIPLSPVVDGFRMITTEGKTLLGLGPELLIIGIWTIVIYFVTAKTFRWE